ncbi:hypothetical protein PHLGIDRAFT_114730 [Phlebiopsis gigantea 11061_1 CR5-6]|uniref:DUF6533 domain-containing protein n=1 Tax=Phlebiopsis gigantea (strain 11061_1 CR5-6) TaxID=745531 RepID=A0A0C3P0R6_PHLG1|nr:hypothetical protein PHLGIDRAFT_114730 [Phlebiopsis gigantea 11061_1 CR5-6]
MNSTSDYTTLSTPGIEQIIDWTYVDYACYTLAVYDYLITFEHEVNIVWRRRPCKPSMLLLLARFLLISSSLYGIFVNTISLTSDVLGVTGEAFTLVQILHLAFFSALRVYAVWPSYRALSAIVFALGLVPLVTNIKYGLSVAYWFFFEHSDLNGSICILKYGLAPRLAESYV